MKTNQVQKLFSEYLEYCQYYQRLRPATLKNYKHRLKVFFEVMIEVDTTEDLSMKNMIEFFRRLEVRKRKVGRDTVVSGVKQSTIESYWNKLNPFFGWLVIKKDLRENPLQKLKKPQTEYIDRRKLDKRHIEKIIAAINLYASTPLMLKRNQAIFYLLLFCGIRKGELIGLQVGSKVAKLSPGATGSDKRLSSYRGE